MRCNRCGHEVSTEVQVKEDGYSVIIGLPKAPSKHPGGMPRAVPTTVKLIFSQNNGALLGGKASGGICSGELVKMSLAPVFNTG